MIRYFNEVKEGEYLPVRPIGPHTLRTFTREWRVHIFTVWGAEEPDDLPNTSMESGWLPEMSRETWKSRKSTRPTVMGFTMVPRAATCMKDMRS